MQSVEADDSKAHTLYTAAASNMHQLARDGDDRALLYLGVMYRNGLGVQKSDARAATCYRTAAENGFAPAQFNLASLLLQGIGEARNGEAAAR